MVHLKHLDTESLALDIVKDMAAKGYHFVKEGDIPDWMELVSVNFPCGPLYRVTP